MPPTVDMRRHRLLLPLAFAFIAVLFAATQLVSWGKARAARQEALKITSNMVASIELIARMTRDIDTERFLIDEHILETDDAAQARLEGLVAQADADFAEAGRRYAPVATLPGEAVVWRRVMRDVASVREPRTEALALSRANRDVEARTAMRALDRRFVDIAHDMNDLIDLNGRGVDRSLGRLEELHRSTTSVLELLGLLGLLATLVVGAWTTRLVVRHDEEIARYSSLLEGQNRELDAFAGRVAHDLRSPLATVSMNVSMLANGGGGAGQPLLDRITRGVKRMEALIHDLLLLSRAGAELGDEMCDPCAAAEKLREEFAALHAADDIELRLAVQPARVRGRSELLVQALTNLTDNAAKYRRRDVRALVALEGRVAGGRYELRVADNGLGMAPDDVQRVFEPFHRADHTRDRPGTGLGMSIVKRIIDASGGTVVVESQLGRGTTVVIRLPLAAANGELVQPGLRDSA